MIRSTGPPARASCARHMHAEFDCCTPSNQPSACKAQAHKRLCAVALAAARTEMRAALRMAEEGGMAGARRCRDLHQFNVQACMQTHARLCAEGLK